MKTTKIYIAQTLSTNVLLINLLKSAAPEEGLTAYAGFQTAGRGQKGTAWESEPFKNLLFSFVLYPKFVRANEQFIISQLVSLAIKETLDKYADGFCIKWPNDIYYNDRKIAGILIENELLGDRICSSVIGVGLNVNQEQFLSDAPNPVSLKQITGQVYDIETLLDEILKEVAFFYELSGKSPAAIAEKYRKSLWRQTGYHRFEDAAGTFMAQIKDVSGNGLLTLSLHNGEEKKYAFKEVKFI
ncbi:MAG: biotin--[acetyl-CoA-carboxylase] ligase [Prevotella sp.]|jgi:BirA family biotin operon repressor/biotin-[acetyl-CoA-carboxylase] ligase|nr:biotin--[acetyl-CoA-carboxylase] ligase [Prevotella sp.]